MSTPIDDIELRREKKYFMVSFLKKIVKGARGRFRYKSGKFTMRKDKSY